MTDRRSQILQRVTELERKVLEDIVHGRDPYRSRARSGTRVVSQAIGRLEQKGLVNFYAHPKRATDAGVALCGALHDTGGSGVG